MTAQIYKAIVLSFLGAAMVACGSSSTGSDSGGGKHNQNSTPQYTLSTEISPSGSGSVDPSSGTYDEGTAVNVEATAGDGYKFSKWTGDIQSTDNPLSVTMDQDYSLTANFVETTSKYVVTMTISDSLHTADNRKFGQKDSATDDFDPDTDVERPDQNPPGDALIAYFKSNGHKLLEDYRSPSSTQLLWNLQLRAGAGDSLSLNWTIDKTKLNGTLRLQSSDGNIDIDMTNRQKLDFKAADYDSLLIKYQLSN